MNRQCVAERPEQTSPPDDGAEQQLRLAQEMEAASRRYAGSSPSIADELATEAQKIREFVNGGDHATDADDESGIFYFPEEQDDRPSSGDGFRAGPRLAEILEKQQRMLPDRPHTMPLSPGQSAYSQRRQRLHDVVRGFLRWLSRQLRRL